MVDVSGADKEFLEELIREKGRCNKTAYSSIACTECPLVRNKIKNANETCEFREAVVRAKYLLALVNAEITHELFN